MKPQHQPKSILTTLTQGLLLGGLLTGIASQAIAAGKREFGNPQHIKVESFAKKMLAAPLQDKVAQGAVSYGRSALIILPWEIDDNGVVEKLDVNGKGTSQMVKVGKGGLVVVRLVDEKATQQTGSLVFQAPQYLEFGDSASGCFSCEWENDVAVGDMDNDGFLDIVALNAFTKTVTIFYNDGAGNFVGNQQRKQEVSVLSSNEVQHYSDVGWRSILDSDHPFQLTLCDLNQDGKLDIAVRYLDSSGETTVHVFNGSPFGTYLENTQEPGIWIYGKEIPYRYGSPYYTLTNTQKNYYQLFSTPTRMNSPNPHQLIINRDGEAFSYGPHLNFYVAKEASGSLGLSDSWNFHLVSQGGGDAHSMRDGSSIPTLRIPGFFGEAFVQIDFDLDGNNDFATVLVSDRETQQVGDLRVGFGDRSSTANPFQAPVQYTRANEARLPWKYNPVQMVTGNFFNTRNERGLLYSDIAVLGTDVVTVWPNGNLSCDLAPVKLQDVTPTALNPGDKITLRGDFGLGTKRAVTNIRLDSLAAFGSTIFFSAPFANSVPGKPDTITLEIPANAGTGTFALEVSNACSTSKFSPLSIQTLPNSGLVTVKDLAPSLSYYGKTITVNGENFQNRAKPITQVQIRGRNAGQTGIFWNAFPGMNSGQFEVKSNFELVLHLPTYAQAKQMGIDLFEGPYDLTVFQQGVQNKMALFLGLEADKPIITEIPGTADSFNPIKMVGQGFRNPDVTKIRLTHQITTKEYEYQLGSFYAGFNADLSIWFQAPSFNILPRGPYFLQLESLKGTSDMYSLTIQ